MEIIVGSKVVDLSGFRGVVYEITYYEGRKWYNVRFERGCAVRFPEELTLV